MVVWKNTIHSSMGQNSHRKTVKESRRTPVGKNRNEAVIEAINKHQPPTKNEHLITFWIQVWQLNPRRNWASAAKLTGEQAKIKSNWNRWFGNFKKTTAERHPAHSAKGTAKPSKAPSESRQRHVWTISDIKWSAIKDGEKEEQKHKFKYNIFYICIFAHPPFSMALTRYKRLK